MIFEEPKPIPKPVSLPVHSTPPVEPPIAESGDEEPLVLNGIVFPRQASVRIRSMSGDERAEWDADRLRAQTDPIYLSEILGMDLQENPHWMLFKQLITLRGPDFPMSNLDPFHKKMVLWPRGVAKTTSVRVLMVGILLNYPAARLCFLTGGDLLAKRQLLALKSCFEKPTERFEYLFPEFCMKSIFDKKQKCWRDIAPVMGTTQQFSLPCRPTTVFAEPSFAISTPKSVKSGSHFDFLFCDDLVNDQNYQNAAALKKCYDQYVDSVPLLDPMGFIVMTGTRYSFGDAYETIQETAAAAGELSVWHFSIRDCWSAGNCKNCLHAEVFHNKDANVVEAPCVAAGCHCQGFQSNGVKGCLFPRVTKKNGEPFGHSLEYLAQQKAEMGETRFANQYENRAIAVGQQQFTQAMIGAQTIFEPSQMPPYSIAETFIYGDLAYSVDEDRDESVLLVFRKWLGGLYFFHCEAGHWGSNELVERTLKLIQQYRPKSVFLEKGQASDALNNLLIARAPDFRVIQLPIVWVPVSNVKDAKLTRIANIQTLLVGRRVWLYGPMPNYDKLTKQLLTFPRGKHDDYADCLAMACEAPIGYQFESRPQTQQESTPHWLARLHGAQPVEENYRDSGGGSGMACGG